MFKPSFNQKAEPDPYQGGASGAHSPSTQFTIALLTKADIPAFLALQATVRDHLPESCKHHLKERTADDLAAHLDAGMPLIGARTADGTLVGQVLMSFPDNSAAKNLEGYPVHGIEGKTAIVQSVAIHPDYRGKAFGLAGQMHQAVIETAQENSRAVLMAKVADTNPASQGSFLKSGFTVAAEGLDPAKLYPVKYYAKEVEPDRIIYSAASVVLARGADIA